MHEVIVINWTGISQVAGLSLYAPDSDEGHATFRIEVTRFKCESVLYGAYSADLRQVPAVGQLTLHIGASLQLRLDHAANILSLVSRSTSAGLPSARRAARPPARATAGVWKTLGSSKLSVPPRVN